MVKNKFEQRAREIYNMVDFVDFNGKINPEETAILAMCELAEEIENDWLKANKALANTIVEMTNSYKKLLSERYTKEQVGELLTKQKELCSEKAEILPNEGTFEDFIDKDSILNAKLEI